MPHPLRYHGDLSVGESQFFGKIAIAVLRQPRRHVPPPGNIDDLTRMFLGIFICQQGKWRGFVGPVARCAISIKNRCNVLIKGGRRGGSATNCR